MHSFYLCALSPKTFALKKLKEKGKEILNIFAILQFFQNMQQNRRNAVTEEKKTPNQTKQTKPPQSKTLHLLDIGRHLTDM